MDFITSATVSNSAGFPASAPRACDWRIPDLRVQTTPAPAHVMHRRKPRRSTPSEDFCSSMDIVELLYQLGDHLFHDDRGGHVGVDLAVIPVGAGGFEGKRVLFVGIECAGIESGLAAFGGGGVGSVVLIDPGDG